MSLSDAVLLTLSSLQSKLEEEKEKIMNLYQSSIVSIAPGEYTDRYGEIVQKPIPDIHEGKLSCKLPTSVWIIDFYIGRDFNVMEPGGHSRYTAYGGYLDNYGNLYKIQTDRHESNLSQGYNISCDEKTCECKVAWAHSVGNAVKYTYKYPLSNQLIDLVKKLLIPRSGREYDGYYSINQRPMGFIRVLEKMLPVLAEREYNQTLLLKQAEKERAETIALRAEVESLRAELKLLKFVEPEKDPELNLLTFSTSTTLIQTLPDPTISPSLTILEEYTPCKGYFEWTLEKIVLYSGYSNVGDGIGTPMNKTIKPISKEYIQWVRGQIPYCLAKILFQIRYDEIPIEHKDCTEVVRYIRPYVEIQSELEACTCDGWGEDDHSELIDIMTHYAELKLTMWITFDSSNCSCKIPADYPIPMSEWEDEDNIEDRRWKHF